MSSRPVAQNCPAGAQACLIKLTNPGCQVSSSWKVDFLKNLVCGITDILSGSIKLLSQCLSQPTLLRYLQADICSFPRRHRALTNLLGCLRAQMLLSSQWHAPVSSLSCNNGDCHAGSKRKIDSTAEQELPAAKHESSSKTPSAKEESKQQHKGKEKAKEKEKEPNKDRDESKKHKSSRGEEKAQKQDMRDGGRYAHRLMTWPVTLPQFFMPVSLFSCMPRSVQPALPRAAGKMEGHIIARKVCIMLLDRQQKKGS